jgi:hypothetical protein
MKHSAANSFHIRKKVRVAKKKNIVPKSEQTDDLPVFADQANVWVSEPIQKSAPDWTPAPVYCSECANYQPGADKCCYAGNVFWPNASYLKRGEPDFINTPSDLNAERRCCWHLEMGNRQYISQETVAAQKALIFAECEAQRATAADDGTFHVVKAVAPLNTRISDDFERRMQKAIDGLNEMMDRDFYGVTPTAKPSIWTRIRAFFSNKGEE